MWAMEITETFHAATRSEWRAWLAEHHATKDEVWLVSYRKHAGRASVPYAAAVEEALCVGWIDSTRKSVDGDRFAQPFSRRRRGSGYSQTNRERLAVLIEEGRVLDSVLADLADWAGVDNVAGLVDYDFPDDILDALRADPDAWRHFQSFTPAYRRIRVAYVDHARGRGGGDDGRGAEFEKRLEHLVRKCAEGKQFGYGIERFYGVAEE